MTKHYKQTWKCVYIMFIPFISSNILFLNNIFYDYFKTHISSLDSPWTTGLCTQPTACLVNVSTWMYKTWPKLKMPNIKHSHFYLQPGLLHVGKLHWTASRAKIPSVIHFSLTYPCQWLRATNLIGLALRVIQNPTTSHHLDF